MKHILVPCDFSDEAEEAFIFSISMARRTGGKITVLHVLEHLDTRSVNRESVFAALEQSAEDNFRSFYELHGHQFENIKLVVMKGEIPKSINAYAAEHNADLIVMGTKGAAGLKEIFIGSNTERIVRFSRVPVFAIRKAVDPTKIKKIVYPTSLELNQIEFIRKLKELQKFFNASLHLLYVNTPDSFMDAEDFREFIHYYQLADVTFSSRNSTVEKEGILDFVREEMPDLLVMATHGRKGLSHLFSGSITEDVVNSVTCPIWTCQLKKTDHNIPRPDQAKAKEEWALRHIG